MEAKAVEKKRGKKGPSIYLMSFESEFRWEQIKEALDNDGFASESVDDFSTQNTGSIYAAIIFSVYRVPAYLARVTRGQQAATQKRKLNIYEYEEIPASIVGRLVEIIMQSLRGDRGSRDITQLGRLTPSENATFLRLIEQESEEFAELLRKKGRADDRVATMYSPRAREVLAMERDAVGLSMEIAFSDRDQLRVETVPTAAADFLEMVVKKVGTIEDEVIVWDKDRFPGLTRLRAENPRISTFEHNGEKLHVIHANRNKLEHTLGVDLIYLAEKFNSLVAVQYKMMAKFSSGAKFHPDKHFLSQLEKVKKADEAAQKIQQKMSEIEYRINPCAFFYKFVSRIELNFVDDDLCPGMYLPLELISHIASIKPRQAILQEKGSQTRHLSNTEFSNLVREGWLGSYSSQVSILKNLIEETLAGGRSLVLAIKDRGRTRKVQRRRS